MDGTHMASPEIPNASAQMGENTNDAAATKTVVLVVPAVVLVDIFLLEARGQLSRQQIIFLEQNKLEVKATATFWNHNPYDLEISQPEQAFIFLDMADEEYGQVMVKPTTVSGRKRRGQYFSGDVIINISSKGDIEEKIKQLAGQQNLEQLPEFAVYYQMRLVVLVSPTILGQKPRQMTFTVNKDCGFKIRPLPPAVGEQVCGKDFTELFLPDIPLPEVPVFPGQRRLFFEDRDARPRPENGTFFTPDVDYAMVEENSIALQAELGKASQIGIIASMFCLAIPLCHSLLVCNSSKKERNQIPRMYSQYDEPERE